jgi:hypothetical protein
MEQGCKPGDLRHRRREVLYRKEDAGEQKKWCDHEREVVGVEVDA